MSSGVWPARCAPTGLLSWVLGVVCTAVFAGAPVHASDAAVPPETGLFFHDVHGVWHVTPAGDEVLVALRPGTWVRNQRPAFLGQRTAAEDLPEHVAELELGMEQRGLFVVRGPLASQDWARHREVAWVLPVLYPSEGGVPFYLTNEVVAGFRPQVTEDEVRALADELGCDVKPLARGNHRYLLVVRDTQAVFPLDVANAVHAREDLALYAHPDFFVPKVRFGSGPILDPLYALQWHLDGDEFKGAAAGSDINAEVAWDSGNGPFALGRPEVRVAIIDDAVQRMHPDLFPNWATGLNLDVDPPTDDPSPNSGQSHGTACAGVAVAAANALGVRGAAPHCGLIGIKFFSAPLSATADAYYFAIDPNNDGDHSDGATVLSNSWGFASGTFAPADIVTAIHTAASTGRNGKGALVLFAAANSAHTVNGVSALAQLPSVLAIGGSNSHAEHTEFSDVGPEVAVVAPTNDRGTDGVRRPWLDITTTDLMGSSGYNGLPDLDYTNAFGGTSSATPLAAGVFALVVSQDLTMSAAQARAIVQRTAVRLDEPYGRFDGITGHSHRFGFGKVDAGAAVHAALAGIRWPDRIRALTASAAGSANSLVWTSPSNDYAGSLLVRSSVPFAWMPTDGETYEVGAEVAPGVTVIYSAPGGAYVDAGADSGGFFYGVYPYSATARYGFGARAHVLRDAVTLFADNSEIPDPGWTTGGAQNEWTRGIPTSSQGVFTQAILGSGPLAGLNGLRAIGGNNCWGTDRAANYNANANAWLQTPLMNLTGVTRPVFLEYWDWCLLETPYDTCFVEVVDADDQLLGVLDADTGGDYDWTLRVYDLTPFAGQPVKVRFRLQADELLQRDGWFIDDVRIVVAGSGELPPVARPLYRETPAQTEVATLLRASDPNPGDVLTYEITQLPAHGQLRDPNAGPITSVPYTLSAGGAIVAYTPATGYEGPDVFLYRAFDGGLHSNAAPVRVSVGTPQVAYDFPLQTNPGWLTEGLWAYGQPQGNAGDPVTGYTGARVYGYNLAGAYTNDMPPRSLTTLPLNCTGLSRVSLRFARWLTVESASADGASIEVTHDGVHWHTVWNNPTGNLIDTSWNVVEYNIAAVADEQSFVQVRWVMGPTNRTNVFGGWNVDDVQVLAIGTPQENQAPFAQAVHVSTPRDVEVSVALAAIDANQDPLVYELVSLPTVGMLREPGGPPLEVAPVNLAGAALLYTPEPGFVGDATFTYRARDGLLDSNIATVTVQVLAAAPFPFEEDFEAGPPFAPYWYPVSTATGRIRLTTLDGPLGNYHATMDTSYAGTFSLNELTLVVDLSGASFVRLAYDWKNFADEVHPLPATWTGSFEGDGVAISADGNTWYRIADFTGATNFVWNTTLIDLDQAAAAAGLVYHDTFRIRFQQYDNQPIPSDGIALDNIRLIQGTSDPVISTATLPPARLDLPYGPVAVEVLGGDPPLAFEVRPIYVEEPLGANLFTPSGVPQGWIGGNEVFDYTLPFAFPFYGFWYTEVKIAIDGWINFGPFVGSAFNNSTALLAANRRIAPLWDNLRTDQGGDIYIDESVPDQVTITWVAVTHTGFFPCEFSATLYADGRIRFDYAAGNSNLTPTIGVSAGDNARYALSAYDGAAALSAVDSVEFDLSRLPSGVSLLPDGTLFGTPTETGRFKPLLRVTDNSGRTDARLLVLRVVPDLFGDADTDGDVDFDDFELLVFCMDAAPRPPWCIEFFDGDGNGTVDLADFALFQVGYTGPLLP
ncbi:MAG: S8 family serine peptidase [Phycisphaerales bacterium]|nr:S8 family serine peptidase [Phycisphaerales bacterium]